MHSHLTPHGYGFELSSHNWNNDGEIVFTPSCYKYVTIENMLLNMSESEGMGASWAYDDKDMIMIKLIWSERGCEFVHPGLLRHPQPNIHPDVNDDTEIIEPTPEEAGANGDRAVKSLEDIESDSDSEDNDVECVER